MPWVDLIILLSVTGLTAIAAVLVLWWCLRAPHRASNPAEEN